MTTKYINTAFTSGSATFTDVNTNSAGPVVAICNNATRSATVSGGSKVAMIAGSLTINSPFEVADCAVCPAPILNESIKIQWNFRRGTTINALKAEMERIFAVWVAQDELAMGLVPPVYEQFAV